MRLRLRERPNFGGELYGIQFVNGLSTEDVPQFMYNKFAFVLGNDPVYVPDDPCMQCEEYKQIIADLKKKAK